MSKRARHPPWFFASLGDIPDRALGLKFRLMATAAAMYYFKSECEGFIRFPNARKHLKQRGRRPSGFIVFERLEA